MWILILPTVAVVTLVAVLLRRSRWAGLSLRISRWTYAIVFPLSLLYFPATGGGVRAVRCEWTFDWTLAVYSLRNYPHIVMFAIFFMITLAQFRNVRGPMIWSFALCLIMGFLVEIAEGATGIHHCRMRDLIPDTAGACIGALVVVAATRARAWRRRAENTVS